MLQNKVIRKLPEPSSFFSPLLAVGYAVILLLLVILFAIVCSIK